MRITSIILLLLSSLLLDAQGIFDEFNGFFGKYVTIGLVDYKAIKENPKELNALKNKISAYSYSGKSADEKKAFLINSYNLLVIAKVVDNYPIKSPMDVSGFFDKADLNVAGETLSLNDIENKKIRPVHKDARIHFVLVCAALGCPKIIDTAYFPKTLDSQLDKQTKKTMNDPQFIRLSGVKVEVSEIFKWYKSDFDDTGKPLIVYINEYRSSRIDPKKQISYYEYDWTLNEKK